MKTSKQKNASSDFFIIFTLKKEKKRERVTINLLKDI